MLILLSPAKTLDETSPLPKAMAKHTPTQPALLKETAQLVKLLKPLRPAQLASLMGISDKLAALNAARYEVFATPFTAANACPALFTFKGDVYEAMCAHDYTAAQLAFAQAHLRILSGLYGVLRPLDFMQPYRLEMGTGLANPRGKDLYAFWGNRIAKALNNDLRSEASPLGAQALNDSLAKQAEPAALNGPSRRSAPPPITESDFILNLASQEYAKAVDRKALTAPVIDVAFKEKKGKELKIIGLFSKRARGLMADWIITSGITQAHDLPGFDREGYAYAEQLSTPSQLVFVR